MQEHTSSKSTGDTSDTGGASSDGASYCKSLYVPGHGFSENFSDTEEERDQRLNEWRKAHDKYKKTTTESTTVRNAPERDSVLNVTDVVQIQLSTLVERIQTPQTHVTTDSAKQKENFLGTSFGVFAAPDTSSVSATQGGPSTSQDSTKSTETPQVIIISEDEDGTPVLSTIHKKKPRGLCPWVHGNAKPPVTTQKDKDKIIEDEEWTKMNVDTLRKVLSVFGCHPNNDNKPDLVKTAKNHKHGQGLMLNAMAHEKGFNGGGQSMDKTKKLYCLHSYLQTYNHETKTFDFKSESEPDEAIVNIVENQTDKKTESVSPVTTIPSMVTAVPRSVGLEFLRKNLAMSLTQSRIQKDGGPTPAKEMPMSQQISDNEESTSEEVNDKNPTSPQDGGLTPTEEKPMSQECNDTEQEIDGSTETGESQETTSESVKLDSLAEFRSLEYWQKSDYRGGGLPTLWSRRLESQERHEDQKNERARKRQKGLPSRSPSPQFEQSSQLLD